MKPAHKIQQSIENVLPRGNWVAQLHAVEETHIYTHAEMAGGIASGGKKSLYSTCTPPPHRCEQDVNECEREECENGGTCINTFGTFYCNCTAGFAGQSCGLRPVVVPNMQAGHSYVGKEELIGIAAVLLVIFVLVVLFVAFRKRVFQKSYSRNNMALVQDPATAALLNKANGMQFMALRGAGGEPCGLYAEPGAGPPQVPVRPMAYTPCFQGGGGLDKMTDGLGGEHTEMTTFHPESPRILTARRGVVVCSVAPNLPPVSPCRSDCDSIRKNPWEGDEGKLGNRLSLPKSPAASSLPATTLFTKRVLPQRSFKSAFRIILTCRM